MQGLTEAPWREIMAQRKFGVDEWCAPFVRIEKGLPRRRDIRDILPENNTHQSPIPQIIFKDTNEFCTLVDAIIGLGYKRIDLNLGCPFALQMSKGRGCGALTNMPMLAEVSQCMQQYTDIEFSAKIRLGIKTNCEWRETANILNEMPLHHITVHPRTAAMQYKGTPDLDAFETCIRILSHPIVYNGDIKTPDDIQMITNRFANLHGIMIGRGLVTRPTLVTEYLDGETLDASHLRQTLSDILQSLCVSLRQTLNDDNQVLAKLKTYWSECTDIIDHKTAKAIKKARNLNDYNQVIATMNN